MATFLIHFIFFLGAAYRSLRKPGESVNVTEESRWIYITDRQLVPLADQLLVHVARSVFVFASFTYLIIKYFLHICLSEIAGLFKSAYCLL